MRHSSEISEEMYHRLYRLARRQVDARLIAAALNIPLHTVNTILARMSQRETTDDMLSLKEESANHPAVEAVKMSAYLDIYFYPKVRYAVLQLVGTIDATTIEILAKEFQRIQSSSWKAIAVQMIDVTSIDEQAGRKIIEFYEDMIAHGRYFAILDPAEEIESNLQEYGIGDKIPIFGTERTFEEKAFSHKHQSALWKNRP